MIIGIHQPNYLPWIGYFYIMSKSDTFVFLDDVQYIKNSFINRNKIKTPQGECWLTVPVDYKGNFGKKINEIRIKNELNWNQKHLKTIELNYKKAKYFYKYFEEIYKIMTKNYIFIDQLNMELIIYLAKQLNIDCNIVKDSDINANGQSTERLVNICKALNGYTYLSGKGGEKYQDEAMFRKNKIELIYSDFTHPVYNQMWGGFLENLSVIDLLFNYGEESCEILNKSFQNFII